MTQPHSRSSLLSRALCSSILALVGLAAVTSCSSDDPSGSKDQKLVTWHQDIAPLVAEKCGSCHSDNSIGPFSVESYEEAYKWASKMDRDIQSGAMPPWGAQETDECTPPAKFQDDLRLTAKEKALFKQWITDGRPEGDPEAAAELPIPAPLDIQDADLQLTIPSAATVEGTKDQFICFSMDLGIEEKLWLTDTQIKAGNPAIVHHALVFLDRNAEGPENADENGQYPCFGGAGLSSTTLLGVWAPGAVPASLPDNVGTPLLPGDRVVVQIHYHPTGSGAEVDDSTRIDFKWTTEEPDYTGGIFLIGNFEQENMTLAGGEGYGLTTGPDFAIPAGASDHLEINRFHLDDQDNPLNRLLPIRLWMVGTHMHYVGVDMKLSITNPQGAEQCLVQTPSWDFNWQRGYYYEGAVEDLPAIHLGDDLTMRCTYNNSMSNPFVREALESQGHDEPIDVKLGEETLDEMCLGVLGIAVPKENGPAFGF